MATDGAMAVVGGNWQIFQRMVEASGAQLRLNTSVTSLERTETGTWTVSHNNGVETGEDEFDAVVIAGPHQYTGIQSSSYRAPKEIEYVRLHVTLFASPLLLSPA